MNQKSEHDQVVQDESDAEVRYLQSIEQAKRHAKAIADDATLSESKRVAAAETEAALNRIEEARIRAQAEADQETTKRTFWDWLRGV